MLHHTPDSCSEACTFLRKKSWNSLNNMGKIFFSSFHSLWNIFMCIASDYSEGQIICILDAIDECETNGRSQIARAICKLYEAESSTFFLKFLLTSRPYVHIQREFQILENRLPTIHLRGENQAEVDKISIEIDIVIKNRVEKLGEKLQLLPEERQILQHELTRIPNRTYLWVYLMFDVIEDMISITKDDLRRVIWNIPKTVEAAYDKILCRSRNREKAMRLLHIVVAAERPLSLREMALALAINENHRSYADLVLEPEPRFRQTVRELCGLFVTIIDARIYLLHQTAKEFLVQQDTIRIPSSRTENLQWKFSLQLVESHRIVAQICIWYLLFDEFKSSSPLSDTDVMRYSRKHVFLNYSAKNWVTHFREAHVLNDSPIQNSLLLLFSVERAMTWYGFYTNHRGCPQSFNKLILVSFFEFEGVARLLLERAATVEARDEDGLTSLWWAACGGHEAVVQLLLINGANIEAKNAAKETALYAAVKKRKIAVFQLLLENEADINAKNANQETSLYQAAKKGDEKTVQLLLRNGANTEAKDMAEETALHQAAKQGHNAIVQLLLKTGADIEAKQISRWSALHIGAIKGHLAVVQMLLENGANIDAGDTSDETALCKAAFWGHEAIVRVLLENNADVYAKNWKRRTALHLAAMNGCEVVVRLLLENGANADVKDAHGETALHIAVANRFKEIVRLLLENDADIQEKGTDGMTALHIAVIKEDEAVVRLLLQNSCLVNEMDYKGNTALHLAAHHKENSTRMAMITILLEAGADINAIDGAGTTVLDELETRGDSEDFISLWRTYQTM